MDRENFFLGFSIEGANLLLKIYNEFWSIFCDVRNLDQLEKDTNFPLPPLAGKELRKCIRPKMKAEWEQQFRSIDCSESFNADAYCFFFLRTCFAGHKIAHNRGEPTHPREVVFM